MICPARNSRIECSHKVFFCVKNLYLLSVGKPSEGSDRALSIAVKASEVSDCIPSIAGKPSETSDSIPSIAGKPSEVSDCILLVAVKVSEDSDGILLVAGKASEVSDCILLNAGKPSEASDGTLLNAVKPSEVSDCILLNAGKSSEASDCALLIPDREFFTPNLYLSGSERLSAVILQRLWEKITRVFAVFVNALASFKRKLGSKPQVCVKKDAPCEILPTLRVLLYENCSFPKKPRSLYPPPS